MRAAVGKEKPQVEGQPDHMDPAVVGRAREHGQEIVHTVTGVHMDLRQSVGSL